MTMPGHKNGKNYYICPHCSSQDVGTISIKDGTAKDFCRKCRGSEWTRDLNECLFLRDIGHIAPNGAMFTYTKKLCYWSPRFPPCSREYHDNARHVLFLDTHEMIAQDDQVVIEKMLQAGSGLRDFIISPVPFTDYDKEM